MRLRGQVGQGEVFVELLLHDLDALLDLVVGTLLHIIEHRQPEGAQETIETEVGVEQVLDVVHEVEVMEDIPELRDAAYQWRRGMHRFAVREIIAELIGQEPCELGGVQPPGIARIGAATERRVLRQQHILVRFHRKSFPICLIPTTAMRGI